MLCLISFIFIFIILMQYANGQITILQYVLYGVYGLLMFYHTSKPYWDYEEYQKNKNKRTNLNHDKKISSSRSK